MTRHIFEDTIEGERQQVIIGWDRPMGRYFGMILPWVETDQGGGFCFLEPVWSNLYEGDGTLSLEEIASAITSRGFQISTEILKAVRRDRRVNAGNEVTRYPRVEVPAHDKGNIWRKQK